MMAMEAAREQMIQQQVRAWDVLDTAVLDAMSSVRREWFVPALYAGAAFADTAIPLPAGQHMLPPKLVGRILQAIALTGRERVLEIGTGSGYLTACLASLSRQVTSLEINRDIASMARQSLSRVSTPHIELMVADAFAPGSLSGQWDAIVLTGSLPVYDPRFAALLSPTGRLFVITGAAPAMQAQLITRSAQGLQTTALFETVVDPLQHAATPPKFSF
jgi:protein-L-isoaspartate(D-aspartate) O-methyltransferase